ncbi:tRNA 2-thiouridine(34) synthase MnmA [Candidatus Falkowbacteria bacterium]|jgi:tRNA-uridine 2-sulfurtransferase|nr:tRNA 2-thiouridine(34) synthase MnmA [Candidatus Falkowbacteria bacterium]MBT4433056.1 tRNA 2-thiouridine(34) synthase MnmA [Candidatus Falkowbacteria bacterium]
MTEKNKKVLVALSGGVDSAVVVFLLKEKGYDITGGFMSLGQVNEKRDKEAAQKIAKQLNIPFKVINLKKEFKKEVMDYFLNEYARGNTPNPCVNCNKKIKLGLLLKKAREMGFWYLATGHYIHSIKPVKSIKSKVDPRTGGRKSYKLFIGNDDKKDQSYFLYNLNQSQLKHLLFPLGGYLKNDIKEIAKKLKLPVLEKESQDICFLSGIDHNVFLEKNLKMKKGPIVTTEGKIVGEHQGLPLYTVGQRRYIKIGGIGPFYAVKMDYKKNILVVTNKFDDKILFKNELIVKQINWVSGKKPIFPFKCKAQIRYGHPAENCIITREKNKYMVKFKKQQRAITPGQSVVFYKKKELLGGGVIV